MRELTTLSPCSLRHVIFCPCCHQLVEAFHQHSYQIFLEQTSIVGEGEQAALVVSDYYRWWP